MKFGQGQALSQRYDMKYNLIVSVNLQHSFSAGASPRPKRFIIIFHNFLTVFYIIPFSHGLFKVGETVYNIPEVIQWKNLLRGKSSRKKRGASLTGKAAKAGTGYRP